MDRASGAELPVAERWFATFATSDIHDHRNDAAIAMRGHVLRVHPEKVPNVVARLMKNEAEMAVVRMQAEQQPEFWKRLMEYIAERQN